MRIAYLCLLAFLWMGQALAAPMLPITAVTTPRGLHVWFVQDTHLPIVTVKFSLQGGAQLDAMGKEGTAELLSTLLDEGAGTYDAETFQNLANQYGIKMDFANGRDYFSGSLKTTTPYIAQAIDLFSAALNTPHIDDAAITRMRAGLLANLRFQQEDPDWLAGKILFEKLFVNDFYARLPEGTEKSLSSVTRPDLLTLKKKLFCKERLKIAVVGDIAPRDMTAMVDRFFGDWPSCGAITITATTLQRPTTAHILRDGAQTVLLMAQRGVARQDPDWWPARILDFALGGGEFSSRLMEEIRVKRGYTYGIASALSPLTRAPLWVVQAGIDPVHRDDAIALIKKIWNDVGQNGLTDAEIAEAKSYMNGALPLMLTNSDQIASIVLQLQQDNLPIDTLDHRAELINAVTAVDIKRVAKKYLQAENMTLVTIGPTKDKP